MSDNAEAKNDNSGKKEGELTFDINSGKFWITDQEAPVTDINFGDSFEVYFNNSWVETSIEISSDTNGDLVFHLKGTDYAGFLDGLRVRK